MGKKNTTQSALKKSSNIFLKNTKSKFALQRLFNNFRESKSDNLTEVDQAPQCVFLGALCLKPVPDIFHVTLQPISSRQQSNKSILYNNNKSRTISDRGKLNKSRKGKNNTDVCQKSATYCSQSAAINNNFFIGNVSDQKSENKILKLFGKVKQSIQEEVMDKSKVKEKLKEQTKSKKGFEDKIDLQQKFSSNPTKTELSDHKLENKSFSELKISMSSERFRDYENFVPRGSYGIKQTNILNSKVQKNSIEKDIAVENVIRQLRQKKNIEVKKVNDMDSKLKRISPMIENKPKSEGYDQSKSFIINLDSYQPKNTDIGQKIHSEEEETQQKDFLDLEEDDIEDYLEIDQNIVEDLQALIPEEEIVSISNSLIQPEDYSSINSVEDTTVILESKPEDIRILVQPSTEDIPISNSSKGQTVSEMKPQEIELKIKNDETIENNVESQHDEDSPPNNSGIDESIKDAHESLMINNNESSSEIDNKILPQFTPDVETLEPSKRTTDEDIPEPKRRKISPKIEKSKPKKKERKSYKLKPNPSVSKNLRKITDFLFPNCIKIASPEEQKPQINEIAIAENSHNITVTVENDSLETVKSEEDELPYKTRTLRSRCKLPLKTVNKPEAQEIQSPHENKSPEDNNKEQNLSSESSSSISGDQIEIKQIINEPSAATEIRSPENICKNERNNEIPILDETKSSKNTLLQNDDIQLKNGLSNEKSTTFELARNMEIRKKSELSENTIKQNKYKRQPKRGNKGNAKVLNFFNQSKEKRNAPKDQDKVIEIVALNPGEQAILSNTDPKEEVYIPETTIEAENKSEIRDSNENHVFTGSSVEKEQITGVEITDNLLEKGQITAIESTETFIEKDQITTVETTDISSEKEQIPVIETANTLSVKEQIAIESTTEKEQISVTESTENSSEKEQISVVEATKVKQAKKKRKRAIQRKKKSLKIQDESNIQTNDTKIGEEETTNGTSARPQNSGNNKIKELPTKKGKSKPQKRNLKNDTESEKILGSLDNTQTKVGAKNRETTLQIYDFDDKSSEEEELPKKLVKKRKFRILGVNDVLRKNTTDIPPKRRSKFNDTNIKDDRNADRPTKKQIKPEIVNNNTPDINLHASKNKSPTDFRSEDKTHKDEKMSVDLNDTTASKVILKASPETEEYGQDWKPLYGPYKRIDRCNVCLVAFKSYKKLRAHKKIHEVENPYKCSECDDCFEDVEKLAAHLRIHKGKMPYPCKKCDATFWTSFQLERHQLVHVLKKVPPPAKPPSKVFKCEECGKVFKKICDLERHTRVHTGEKPSVCNICNKRFQQSYNLNKHLYTHTQEKNYECVICQKKFGRNDVLNRHVLTHSIVKPFRCSVCSRTFIRNSQLKLHLRKHHGLDEDPGNETNADDPVAGTSAKV